MATATGTSTTSTVRARLGTRALSIAAALLAPGFAGAGIEQPRGASGERLSTLENRHIRLGVDLSIGGAITYLSRSGRDQNVVNSHDWGRQIQQSYYSGPKPFGKPHPAWKDWPWNPITSGDVYGNRGRVLEHRNNGASLYVKSTPMQWALNNVPGDCLFECWVRLEANTARVRCRLTNRRADRTEYPAFDQELPAVYTVGTLHRLVTYDGARPWTGAPVRQVTNVGPPWAHWHATEHWAALLDERDWGLGIVHPGVFRFTGGFHGEAGAGGPMDDATGYLSPIRKQILDPNLVYTYEYTLVLGALAEIRTAAVSQRPEGRPDYRFRGNRQHWTTANAETFPARDCLRVRLERDDPQVIGPEAWWRAEHIPRLYVRAALRAKQTRAELYWRTAEEPGFSADRRAPFDVVPDGKARTYVVDLASAPGYRGTITGVRFDPVGTGGPGETAELYSVSWRRQND